MSKARNITSIVLKAIVSLMLTMSAVMKLSHSPQIMEGFGKSNLINFVDLIGIIEIGSVILLWIPKTSKVGFLLLCGYLGGAISIELAGAQAPTAALFLAVLWIAVYLKNPEMFLPAKNTKA